ncbi:MAG: YchJ family metal-binding protein [Gammaproteobacteria bacterium]|nr:YchJ family metal-binding protein [Gammaproteobacteria bacterium]MCW8922819.1 YchJ family metal-binding protein [Gammaproteobacteria bacterium]
MNEKQCPCGSGESFAHCCEKLLNGSATAETAEQLMRSRYSAYAEENENYLKNTWHAETRPETIEFVPTIKWTRLRIKNTDKGGVNDEQGTIEFIATYKTNGRAFQLHEVSRFVRINGCWVYFNGKTNTSQAFTS